MFALCNYFHPFLYFFPLLEKFVFLRMETKESCEIKMATQNLCLARFEPIANIMHKNYTTKLFFFFLNQNTCLKIQECLLDDFE